MVDPRLAGQVADWMMKNPGQPVKFDSFPEGTDKAVASELNRRHANKKAQDAVNDPGKTPQEDMNDEESARGDEAKKNIFDPRNDGPMSYAASAATGAANGMTLGHSDEIQGLLSALSGGDYKRGRDEAREYSDAASKANPITSGAANFAGAMMIPLPGPKAGATLGAKVGRGMATGAALGAGMGEGYSDKALDDPALIKDIAFGTGSGTVMGAGGAVAGHGISKGMDYLKGGADSMLAKTMGIDPRRIAQMKHDGEFQELLQIVRDHSGPSGDPQTALENIERPHMESGARGANGTPVGEAPDPLHQVGSIPAEMEGMPVPGRKPGAWSPQKGPPRQVDFQEGGKNPGRYGDWYGADQSELSKLMEPTPYQVRGQDPLPRTIPGPGAEGVRMDAYSPQTSAEAPPMNPMAREASSGMARAASVRPAGMDPSTLRGGLVQTGMMRAGTAIGVGGHAAAQKVQNFMQSRNGAGLSPALQSQVKSLVQMVMQSEDPSFTDYLAKETSPHYLALSLEADKDGGSSEPDATDSSNKSFGNTR